MSPHRAACDLDDLVAQLTPRRGAVLELAAKGLTNADIGTALGISAATVRTHMTAIFAELGVANRTEATASFLSYQAAPVRVAAVLARPGLALLPIETGDDSAASSALARGLTADLRSIFARWCWFPVIDPTALLAVASVRDDDAPPSERSTPALAQRLGARFVVRGMLRSAGGGFRLVMRVDEAETGRCVWTDRFPMVSGEPFGVEDAVCEQIVARAYPVLVAHAGRAARPAVREAFDAWTLAHDGMAHQAQREQASNVAGRACFAGALAKEPTLVLAHYGLGLSAYDTVLNQWSDEHEAMALLAQSTDACLCLAPHAAEGHFLEARLHQARGQHARGIPALERAVAQNPSFASAHALLAQLLCMEGRAEEGLVRMEHAARLSPQAFVAGLAVVHFIRHEYGIALVHAEDAIARRPSYAFARLVGAASAWWLGDHAKAHALAGPIATAPRAFAARSFLSTFGATVDGVARIGQALSALGIGPQRS